MRGSIGLPSGRRVGFRGALCGAIWLLFHAAPAAADADAGAPWVYEEPPIAPGPCGNYPATGPDFVLVGCFAETAPYSVSVYEFRHTDDRWRFVDPPLTPSDGAPGGGFGARTAVDGDTAIVGAASTVAGQLGGAYVFVRAGSTWTEQQKIMSPDETAEDSFGSNVAISKDTVVVSARTKTVGPNVNQGAVYVFVRTGTSWSFQQRFDDVRGLARDFYGERIAVEGDTIMVNDLGRVSTNVGKVNVYTRSGVTWTHTDDIVAPDPTSYGGFGGNFLLSGDTVLISAPLGASNTGAVYPFERKAGKWTEGTPILALDFDTGLSFGDAIGLSGDSLLIAAPHSFQNFVNDGLVAAYRRSGAAWVAERKLTLPSTEGSGFGAFLAFVGNDAILFDNNVALHRGSDSTGTGGGGGASGQGGPTGVGSAGAPSGGFGAAGACTECAPPAACDAGRTCTNDAVAGSNAPGGCGCRFVTSRVPLSSGALAMAAAGMALVRRRRRPPGITCVRE